MNNYNNINVSSDKKEILTLRAHHGMCFKYFVGEGYSSDFTKNMGEMKKLLETTNPEVRVVASNDIVCAKCPNLVSGNCLSAVKVAKYDSGVLSACEIEEGTTMPYNDFSKLVTKKVINEGKRELICGDCQWTKLCR